MDSQGKVNDSFTVNICELGAGNLQQRAEFDHTRSHLYNFLCDVQRIQAEVSHLRYEMQTIASQNNTLRDELAGVILGIQE